ncbi:MAG TPA: adenylate/guanylate cyclase domain-containing protein [Gemmatimonadaceae bacterium]
MRFRLTSTDGQHSFEVRPGAPLVVGRAPTSDLPVFDPTISRRHAEVTCDDDGVALRDLGSSNGTFVNGARVESARLAPNDLVTFGKVAFKLLQVSEPPPSMMPTPAPVVGATIVRQVPVRAGGAPLGGGPATIVAGAPVLRDEDKTARKLEMLLEVSKGLGRASDIDATLKQIAEYAYQVLDVDRVAILLDDAGQLVSKIARDKRGGDAPRAVPQSIARKVVEEKVAILSDDAGEDTRFTGQSILMQRVRSALCAPLIGSEETVLGVLYVDNLTTSHRFGEEDLEFLVAFAGIAAVAIENTRFAERIRREMLVRSNFERYFAPSLAERIVASPEAVRLGGEKREVTVLFSDIRGFTALSETMRPDDMASLLTEYFTEMVDIVFRHGGTLDKFIGDAVMAQWGAPIRQDDDADRAMRAAIEMMEALEQLNARWREQGRPELQIGIGLNHGEAFAGNIGSERRLEFTVIGDTVNTASRLCSAAEAREILISDDMRRALTQVPALEECPPMELKGKSQPVPVFRVVA